MFIMCGNVQIERAPTVVKGAQFFADFRMQLNVIYDPCYLIRVVSKTSESDRRGRISNLMEENQFLVKKLVVDI